MAQVLVYGYGERWLSDEHSDVGSMSEARLNGLLNVRLPTAELLYA